MDIWAACKDAATPQPLKGELIRVVESQEQIATNTLVDSLDEQALLEDMLETSKPKVIAGTEGLHYLLATPFRYPPLRHGSRFGTRNEPSLFYGSASLAPALAEAAYYRLVFWSGMKQPPPTGKLLTEHTVFGVRYAADQGLRLNNKPFTAYEEQLASPIRYTATQQLGQNMRAAGIETFEYLSARDAAHGINIALFKPRALADRKPIWQQPWLCETREDKVSFYNKEQGTRLYPSGQFMFDGKLPTPSV